MSQVKMTEPKLEVIEEDSELNTNQIDSKVQPSTTKPEPGKVELTVEQANEKINKLRSEWENKLNIHNDRHIEYESVQLDLNASYAEDDVEKTSRLRAKLINVGGLRYASLIDSYQSLHSLMALSTELKNQHISSLSKN